MVMPTITPMLQVKAKGEMVNHPRVTKRVLSSPIILGINGQAQHCSHSTATGSKVDLKVTVKGGSPWSDLKVKVTQPYSRSGTRSCLFYSLAK